MEVMVLTAGLLVVLAAEIAICVKLNRVIRQLNEIGMVRQELATVTKSLTEQRSGLMPVPNKVFFQKEINVAANQPVSKFDIKLSAPITRDEQASVND